VLPERGLERFDRGVEHRYHRQAQGVAVLLEPDPGIGVDQGVEHQARVRGDLGHDPVEVLARADHRPEMTDHLGPFELRERGLGQHLERFAS
jgi:hypothetical protein